MKYSDTFTYNIHAYKHTYIMQFTTTSKHISVGVEFAVHGWGAAVVVGGRGKLGEQDDFECTHVTCAHARPPQGAATSSKQGNAMQAARKGERL